MSCTLDGDSVGSVSSCGWLGVPAILPGGLVTLVQCQVWLDRQIQE